MLNKLDDFFNPLLGVAYVLVYAIVFILLPRTPALSNVFNDDSLVPLRYDEKSFPAKLPPTS